jgi:predicted RNA-binding Zn-ribbon protein involved in translation (DUF1610 family)
MGELLRVWRRFDLKEVEKHLLVVGELSSECFSCHKVGIDLTSRECPNCGVIFKYMGFRRKINANYLSKIKREYPEVALIDFEDFKRALGKKEARKILDI